MNLLIEIQQKYLTFSKNEKKIADYILKNSQQLNNIKISDLAQKTGTSNATITRFVKKIGGESYAAMKLNISKNATGPFNPQTDNISDEVFAFYQTVIAHTQEFLDTALITKFINLLKQKKQLIVIGVSNSGITAQSFALRLTRMGLSTQSYSDPNWMRMRASIADGDDLFIAISNSGTTKAVVDTLMLARKKNASVVSITSYMKSPVAQLSDLTFYAYNTRWTNNEKFINSQFANVYLIDVLTTYLQEDEHLKKSMLTTRQAIDDL